MEIVKTKDTGTLRYDTYFNDDESECVILEFYRDSRRPSSTPSTSANYRRRSSRSDSVVHGELLGEPSEEIRARMAGSEVPHLFTPYQSM